MNYTKIVLKFGKCDEGNIIQNLSRNLLAFEYALKQNLRMLEIFFIFLFIHALINKIGVVCVRTLHTFFDK